MYQQIKDQHSVIIWSAARCFLSFQQAASVRWRALPTRCPSKEPDLVLKDASHARPSLGHKQSTLLFIYLSWDGSLSTILMNASCSSASQSGTSYLARDQLDSKGSARAGYACWLIDHFFPLYILLFIDCLVTNNDISSHCFYVM